MRWGVLHPRTKRALGVVGAATMIASTAHAAPSRVAVLGPSEAPILPRLQRNVSSLKLDAVNATVSVCTRDVVTRLVGELRVDTALCTDGDQISVWVLDGERLVLKEAVVVQSSDERAQELAAARAAMALQALPAKDAPRGSAPRGGLMIVANGPDATAVPANDAPPGTSPQEKDRPAPVVTPSSKERFAPPFVLGAGPAIAASRHGNSFAISAQADIGVSRYVALVPWVQFVPANRSVEAPLGTASFRPTIFGLGFGIPLLRPSSFVVPRLGAGYGILWMHVAPESATGSASMRPPEDLLAPLIYTTAAASFKVTPSFRAVAEGMVGTSTHDMIVRIGNQPAAHWGVPLASIALRGEWVVQ